MKNTNEFNIKIPIGIIGSAISTDEMLDYYINIASLCSKTLHELLACKSIEEKNEILKDFNNLLDGIIADNNKQLYLLFNHINKMRSIKEKLVKEING